MTRKGKTLLALRSESSVVNLRTHNHCACRPLPACLIKVTLGDTDGKEVSERVCRENECTRRKQLVVLYK